MLHRRWSLLAIAALFSACQPPSDVTRDYVLPETTQNGVGVRNIGLTQGDGTNGAHLVFFNFGGVTLTKGGDDSASNVSQIGLISRSLTIPAFDDSPYSSIGNRTAVINAVVSLYKQYYAPYNVEVVTTRPLTGRYLMIVVGGQKYQVIGGSQCNPPAGCTVGISPLDCGNRQEDNIAFVFSDTSAQVAANSSASSAVRSLARDAAHESGHSFGLEHTISDDRDLMQPSGSDTQTQFVDANMSLEDQSSCDGNATQNSAAKLRANIGASTGMLTGPNINLSFLSPEKQATVPTQFDVAVHATEMGGAISKVEIDVGGGLTYSKTAPPFVWKAPFKDDQGFDLIFTPGSWTLTATAYDNSGNQKTQTVKVTTSNNAMAKSWSCIDDTDCDSGKTCQAGVCAVAPPKCSCDPGAKCQPPGGCTDGGQPKKKDGGSSTSMPVTDGDTGTDPTDNPDDDSGVASQGGCAFAPGRSGAPIGAVLLVLAAFACLRRRRTFH